MRRFPIAFFKSTQAAALRAAPATLLTAAGALPSTTVVTRLALSSSSSPPPAALPICFESHRRFCAPTAPRRNSGTAAADARAVENLIGNGDDTERTDKVIALVGGLFLLTLGIVFINLNERRASKQHDLDDAVEELLVSLTDEDDKLRTKPITSEADVEGLIFHSCAPLVADESDGDALSGCHDPELGLAFPKQLRVRRNVEMFQWVENEHKHERKQTNEKTGKTETVTTYTYTYTKEWKSTKQNIKHDNDNDNDGRGDDKNRERHENPPFPEFPASCRDAKKIDQVVPVSNNNSSSSSSSSISLRLSQNLVDRLKDYSRAQEAKDLEGGKEQRRAIHNVDFVSESARNPMLYTIGGEPAKPKLGDVRVTYSTVQPGEHTILAVYEKSADGKMRMSPVLGQLRETLAKSHGQLIVPDEAHELASRAQQAIDMTVGGSEAVDIPFLQRQSQQQQQQQEQQQNDTNEKKKSKSFTARLTPPDWLIEGAESFMLKGNPIEFCFIKREHATKHEAISHQRAAHDATTQGWVFFSYVLCVCGGGLIGSVASAVTNGMTMYGGLVAGASICQATRMGAQEQIKEKQQERKSGDGVTRKSKGVFEL